MEYGQNSETFKVCFVASAGGHLTQLLKIHEICQGYECVYVSTEPVVEKKLERFGKTYITGECNRQHPLRTLMVMFRCFKIVIKVC